MTSVNVRYLVQNDCIRQGGGSSVNSRIKVVKYIKTKRVIMEQTGSSSKCFVFADKLNGTCTRLYHSWKFLLHLAQKTRLSKMSAQTSRKFLKFEWWKNIGCLSHYTYNCLAVAYQGFLVWWWRNNSDNWVQLLTNKKLQSWRN